MLINCPECNNRISDKAFSCPYCGFPIAQTVNSTPNDINARQTASTGSRKVVKKNHYVPRRLPNGFGSIRHLSGNRRKPFAAHPPVTEYRDNGKDKSATPIVPKAIGYYETYEEAYDALRVWQKKPIDTDKLRATFDDIYKYYYEDKFTSKKELSTQSEYAIASAYKNSRKLHDKVFKDLRTKDFQDVLDNADMSYSTLTNMKSLYNQMSKYALKHDLIEKNYAEFCYNPKSVDDQESGVPFTWDEIITLWKHKDDIAVRSVLILTYTGMRIEEARTCVVDKEKKLITGGVKTRAGKKRTIPIHSCIMPFIDDISFIQGQSNGKYREDVFYPTMLSLGMEMSSENTKHTPHDCRHTFSWLADKYKVDEICKHLIMGHKLKGDIEETTYAHRTLEELTEEMSKIKTP